MNTDVVRETDLSGFSIVGRGKVRDVYQIGEKLLIVSTDRLSAFDVILPDPIPYKGKVLNNLSAFWMNETRHIAPNHLVTSDVARFPEECAPFASVLEGRSMLTHKAAVFPVECVARGYIIGSGWKDYQAGGKICGIPIPPGLKMADKLPEPIFTPSSKAELGDHDENISFSRVVDILGEETARWLRDKTIELYLFGARKAEERGIIIADTKFEFGLVDGAPTLVDEAHDTGFITFLAERTVPSGNITSVAGQAIRSRLFGAARLGQETACPCIAGRDYPEDIRELLGNLSHSDRQGSEGIIPIRSRY